MSKAEQQARELAHKVAAEVVCPPSGIDLATKEMESWVEETILRELNLVALLEDKAILDKATNIQVDIKWMPFSGKWCVEGTLPDLWSSDLRTAITNAMREQEAK